MPKYYKFDSGLTLLYDVNKINTSTSIDIAFDCGARCDGKIPGLSHFCEHMLFTGTDKLSKQETMKRYFDFIKSNAYTSYDEIYFTGSIMTSRLKDYLIAVQDMICNSTFTSSAVEDEKKIVIQEIVRDADSHSRHAGALAAYELYGLEHFKHGILGSKETVNSIKSKDVKNYIKKYFVKNNCIINICSPLSFGKVKNLIKKYFDSKMPSNNLKPLPYKQEKLIKEQKVAVYHKNIDKNFLTVTFVFDRKGPDLKYKTYLSTMCDIIDDISDGLTKELRIDNSLIYSMGADHMINFNNSYLCLNMEVSTENINPCIDVIFNYIKNLRQHGFSKDSVIKDREKDEYYWQTRVLHPKDIKGKLMKYRFYGKFISDIEIHKQSQNVVLDELNDMMRNLFNNAKVQVFVYGDATKKDVYTIKQIEKKFK